MANLTIRGVRTTPVEVPMRYALGTSAATIRAAPLLLIDVVNPFDFESAPELLRHALPASRRIESLKRRATGRGCRRST